MNANSKLHLRGIALLVEENVHSAIFFMDDGIEFVKPTDYN